MDVRGRISECAQQLLALGHQVQTDDECVTFFSLDREWDVYFDSDNPDRFVIACEGLFTADPTTRNAIQEIADEINNECDLAFIQIDPDGDDVGVGLEDELNDFSKFGESLRGYLVELQTSIIMFEDRIGRLQGGQSAPVFEVEGASYFDGSGHRLGPSIVSIKSDRVIIDGTRGGMHQILIRDIGGVSIPNRVLAPKKLLIEIPGAAYEIYCQSKDQVRSIEAEIRDVIMG